MPRGPPFSLCLADVLGHVDSPRPSYRIPLFRSRRRDWWDALLERGGAVEEFSIDGALGFGLWEQVFYGEFDGRRRKRILIKIIGD